MALLTLFGQASDTIIPSNGVTWEDSMHVLLHPDTTTTYQIKGLSACGSSDSAQVTIYIIQPDSISITLSDSVVCVGNSIMVSATGLTSISTSNNDDFCFRRFYTYDIL